MAEKDTGKHELGVAVGVIGIVVAVIGAVAGLAQLQPVRDFVCAQGSVLCRRDHVLHFFKMSYTQSPPLPAAEHADPWMVLLNNISDTTAYFSAIGRSNANTDCVDDRDLSYYLIHHALYSSSTYTVVSGNSRWTFDTAPIDTHNTINLLPGDSLIFFLAAGTRGLSEI